MTSRNKIVRLCNLIDILLIVGFLIQTAIDSINYSSIASSVPLYLYVVKNYVLFRVPGLLVHSVGRLVRNLGVVEIPVENDS